MCVCVCVCGVCVCVCVCVSDHIPRVYAFSTCGYINTMGLLRTTIQWSPFRLRSVLIVGVSAFQGEVSLVYRTE